MRLIMVLVVMVGMVGAPKGLDDGDKAVFAHPLFPGSAVVAGELSDYLSFGLLDEANERVGVAEVPDGHIAGLKLTGGLALAAADGLDLNGGGGHGWDLIAGGPLPPMH
jgi:hypothetical protein